MTDKGIIDAFRGDNPPCRFYQVSGIQLFLIVEDFHTSSLFMFFVFLGELVSFPLIPREKKRLPRWFFFYIFCFFAYVVDCLFFYFWRL